MSGEVSPRERQIADFVVRAGLKKQREIAYWLGVQHRTDELPQNFARRLVAVAVEKGLFLELQEKV